jgi:hypothetical protein
MPNTTATTVSAHMATLDAAIDRLASEPDLVGAREAVDDTIRQRDGPSVIAAATTYIRELAVLRELIDIREKIDPHVLTIDEIAALRSKAPAEIVEEALRIGRLRERRILIEAKEAETNQRLVRLTATASVVALIAVIVDVVLRLSGF